MVSCSEETPGRVKVTMHELNKTGRGWERLRQIRTLEDENRILAGIAREIRTDIERLQTLLSERTKSNA